MEKPVICFLIDDDEDDQEIFSMTLEEMNPLFKCVTANNGIEALQKLNTDSTFIPDYVFLDLNMPRMNGKEFLQEIKKLPHLSHIPIVIYSTSSTQYDIDETKKLGAAYFLTKPSSTFDLKNMLTTVFKATNLQSF